ncbi:MAG: hypothetical protein O7C75_12265 [Verrucomicrobia bacterium]|nr:hypothetical protein [Verrucomicrobiota bacterium]
MEDSRLVLAQAPKLLTEAQKNVKLIVPLVDEAKKNMATAEKEQ